MSSRSGQSVYREIRKTVSETMLACEEESNSLRVVDSIDHVEACLSTTSGRGQQPVVNHDDGIDSYSKKIMIEEPMHYSSDSESSDANSGSDDPHGDWFDRTLKNAENEELYFDALSDLDDETGIDIEEDLNEYDDITEEQKSENLGFELGLWAASFSVSLVSLTALLAVLRVYHPLLPKDPRTLLKTPRQSIVREIAGGAYFHFGVMKALCQTQKLLEYLRSTFQACLIQPLNIYLQINIDGLPIFKSATTQFWPILGRVCNPIQTDPFMIGLYCGEKKPARLDEYFRDFVEEVRTLKQGPVDFPIDRHSVPVHVNLSCFICDTPARAFIKQNKAHSGYYGCDKCVQKGKYDKHKVFFPEIDAELRTDESLKQGRENNDPHHVGRDASPLLSILSLNMVTQFPQDYMHLVCLGVTRRLLMFWLKSPVRTAGLRLGHVAIGQISESLQRFKDYIPREFSRKCRGLDEVERWKATEFRQFLLFSGIVALKGKLTQAVYEHFLLLFVGIHCLASPVLFRTHVEYANGLLRAFVDQARHIYGEDFLVYNVHGLIHLANDVKLFGPLDSYSAFPFENFLGHLKVLVRKPQFPLQQVVRRISERVQHGVFGVRKSNVFAGNNVPRREHRRGPIPRHYIPLGCIQFEQISYNGCFLSCHNGDNCVKIHDAFYIVRNILTVDYAEEHVVVVERFTRVCDFFQHPHNSGLFDIVQCDRLSGRLETANLSEVQDKLVSLPYKETFVLIPMYLFQG